MTTEQIPQAPTSPHRLASRMNEDEIRQRNQEAIRALDALDSIGDEDEERAAFEALRTAIDEEPLSDRKRFQCD